MSYYAVCENCNVRCFSATNDAEIDLEEIMCYQSGMYDGNFESVSKETYLKELTKGDK